VERVRVALAASRAADGGFGPVPGAPSEPEASAMAAIALDDDGARAWLRRTQAADGSFLLGIDDAATAVAALALGNGSETERALDYLLAHRAEVLASDPHPNAVWGWAPHTYGWVDPTARVVLALRRLRPSATGAIEDGLVVLTDRECAGGGWNYGNASVLDQALVPYVHPSAMAMIALHGRTEAIATRGRAWLDAHWSDELGGLSLACTLVARRLLGDPVDKVIDALDARFEASGLLGDTVTLAWATIGLGDGIDNVRVTP
jgi:hypothetical protein